MRQRGWKQGFKQTKHQDLLKPLQEVLVGAPEFPKLPFSKFCLPLLLFGSPLQAEHLRGVNS